AGIVPKQVLGYGQGHSGENSQRSVVVIVHLNLKDRGRLVNDCVAVITWLSTTTSIENGCIGRSDGLPTGSTAAAARVPHGGAPERRAVSGVPVPIRGQ